MLKPYSAMKNSCVKWLGEVPAHWEVRWVGQFGVFSKANGGNKEDEVVAGIPCVRYGDLYTTHQYFIQKSRSCVSSEKAERYTRIKFGDVLFAASGETVDEIGKSAVNLIQSDARCGGDIVVFRPEREVEARYLGYAMDCQPAVCQKATMGRGITVIHIYADQLKRLSVTLPPLSEQTTIVRFLNHADRRIRRYIRAKEALIALLEEQKKVVVHEAVTGRIDVRTGSPYPAYKPSGVEWLGDVPEHWKVVPLKRIGEFSSGVGFPISMQGDTEKDILFAKVSDMNTAGNEKEISHCANTVSSATAAQLGAQVFEYNTIIFPKVGGALLTNKRRLLVRPTCIDNNLMACVVTGAKLKYLFRVLTLLDLGKMALPGPVPAIGEGEVRDIQVPLPPPSEQAAIIRFTGEVTARIDQSVLGTRQQINLLREYRTRLTTDVVTGKLDVREAAAALPEVDPLAGEDDMDVPLDADRVRAFDRGHEPADAAA